MFKLQYTMQVILLSEKQNLYVSGQPWGVFFLFCFFGKTSYTVYHKQD